VWKTRKPEGRPTAKCDESWLKEVHSADEEEDMVDMRVREMRSDWLFQGENIFLFCGLS
jgi:hypothetical protein